MLAKCKEQGALGEVGGKASNRGECRDARDARVTMEVIGSAPDADVRTTASTIDAGIGGTGGGGVGHRGSDCVGSGDSDR